MKHAVAATMAKTSTYSVSPGDNVGFTVNAAISHPGPLSVWMSKAPDGTAANEYDGSGDWYANPGDMPSPERHRKQRLILAIKQVQGL